MRGDGFGFRRSVAVLMRRRHADFNARSFFRRAFEAERAADFTRTFAHPDQSEVTDGVAGRLFSHETATIVLHAQDHRSLLVEQADDDVSGAGMAKRIGHG